jgi:hypothetical protein
VYNTGNAYCDHLWVGGTDDSLDVMECMGGHNDGTGTTEAHSWGNTSWTIYENFTMRKRPSVRGAYEHGYRWPVSVTVPRLWLMGGWDNMVKGVSATIFAKMNETTATKKKRRQHAASAA